MKKLLIALLLLPTLLFAQDIQWTEYSTSGRKNIGLNAKISYPTGFSVSEGRRPHILGSFSKVVDGKEILLLIQANQMDFKKKFGISVKSLKKQEIKELGTVFADGMKEEYDGDVQNVIPTKIEGYPAVMFDMKFLKERVGNTFYTNNQIAIVLTDSHLITLWCGTGGFENDKESVDSLQPQVRSHICYPYFNSFLLLDKYKY